MGRVAPDKANREVDAGGGTWHRCQTLLRTGAQVCQCVSATSVSANHVPCPACYSGSQQPRLEPRREMQLGRKEAKAYSSTAQSS